VFVYEQLMRKRTQAWQPVIEQQHSLSELRKDSRRCFRRAHLLAERIEKATRRLGATFR